MTPAASWQGEDVGLAEVERQLGALRSLDADRDGLPDLRTSVLTHIAWVPREWREAAEDVLEGLGERHPSRTIVLFPDAESTRDAIDAEVAVETFQVPGLKRHVATEVVRLWLRDGRTRAPASIVLPLLIADLPVFLRWRGQPAFHEGPFEDLAVVADRLIVDSREWPDLPAAYAPLAEFFDRVAVSDIAWARTARWRQGIANRWPAVAEAARLRVRGPRTDALLLAGWLRARLERPIRLEHEPAEELDGVVVDAIAIEPGREEPKSPSDLLSDQLEIFGRESVYEQAVRASREPV